MSPPSYLYSVLPAHLDFSAQQGPLVGPKNPRVDSFLQRDHVLWGSVWGSVFVCEVVCSCVGQCVRCVG